MSIGAAIKSRYGLGGWTLVDRGQGAGPELTQWDRLEPRPTPEQLAEFALESAESCLTINRNAAIDRACQLAASVATNTDPTLLLLLGIIEEVVDELRGIKAGRPRASRDMPQLIGDVAKRLQGKKV